MYMCVEGHYTTMAKSFKVSDFFMFMGRLVSGRGSKYILCYGEGREWWALETKVFFFYFYEYLLLH